MLNPVYTYYLAGRMTGLPQFNFPRFFEAASELRARGVTILSPAEIDEIEHAGAAMQSEDGSLDEDGKFNDSTWGDLLSRDVKLIADECDGVIALDDWWLSKGARLEVFVCLQANNPVYEYRNGRMTKLTKEQAMSLIKEHTVKG
jgi:hypothetical protein